MDVATILGSSQGGGPGLLPRSLPALTILQNTLHWDARNFVRQCVRALVCKRDIEVHNNAAKYVHISVSDHERALVHAVLTGLFTIWETVYLKQFRGTHSVQVVRVNRPSSNVLSLQKYQQWAGEDIFDFWPKQKSKIVSITFAKKTWCFGSDRWGLTKHIHTVSTHHFTICQCSFLLKFSFSGVMFGCYTATWRLYCANRNTCFQSFDDCDDPSSFVNMPIEILAKWCIIIYTV